MVQIIAGEKGKGKTKYLIERANSDIAAAEGSLVYLDKNTKHMYELNNRIRMINVSEFPVSGTEGLCGFISGIISQDRDLQYMYIDSFLKLAGMEEDPSGLAQVLRLLGMISERYGINIVLSISLGESDIPEDYRKDIIVSL